MGAILTKTKLRAQALGNAEILRGLAQRMETEGDARRIQSHYEVAGSLEERASLVDAAFQTWRREDGNYDYRYSYVLGTTDNKIYFYLSDWYSDITQYFTVEYRDGADGTIVIDETTIKSATAAIVVTELGLDPDMDGDVDGMAQGGETPAEAPVVQADPGDEQTEATPAVPTPEVPVVADGAGVVVPEAVVSEDVVVKPTPEASAAIPAAVAEAVTEDEKGAEITQSAPKGTRLDALRQSDLARPENLLQSVAPRDKAGKSVCKILKQSKETIDGKEHLVVDCIATRANVINTQGQVYTDKLWRNQLAMLNEEAQAGKFTGKLEHEGDEGLNTVAIRWLPEFQLVESVEEPGVWDLQGRYVVVQTAKGLDLQAMIEAGVVPDQSTVGYGTTKAGKFQGRDVRVIDEDNFFCTAIDAVKHGSSVGSTMTGATTETITPATQSDPTPEGDPLAQSVDNTISDPASNHNQDTTQSTIMEPQTPAQPTLVTQSDKAQALRQAGALKQTRNDLRAEAKDRLNAHGVAALENHLAQSEAVTDADALLVQGHDLIAQLESLGLGKPVAQDGTLTQGRLGETYAPTFFVKQSKEELAPQTPDELFDRMVSHLPENWKHGADIADYVTDKSRFLQGPRAACRQELVNMASHNKGGFNGRAAVNMILALEQGNLDRAQQILDSQPLSQSLSTGATTASGNNNPGGAPLSAPYVFKTVTRVYPQMIMDEIAATQVLTVPKGIIFYENIYRVVDGTNANDKRMDINTSANPFDPNFSNNNTEGSLPAALRYSMASIDVAASSKKLMAEWTVEEMQDLRAYHGIDIESAMSGAMAREIAIEKNLTVLNAMFNGATASNKVYGTVAPATGYDQDKWDAYISVYMTRVMTDVLQSRNNPVTHIVMGTEAWFYFSKAFRFTAVPGTQDTTVAGTTFNSVVDIQGIPGSIRIIVTNLFAPKSAKSYQMLMFRRGDNFADTPFVYSPYATYTGPSFYDPKAQATVQSTLTRDAYTVVVPEAMGLLTINPGGTGVPLT